MTIYQVAPRLEYRWRMTSLALFGVFGGVLVLYLKDVFRSAPRTDAGGAAVDRDDVVRLSSRRQLA